MGERCTTIINHGMAGKQCTAQKMAWIGKNHSRDHPPHRWELNKGGNQEGNRTWRSDARATPATITVDSEAHRCSVVLKMAPRRPDRSKDIMSLNTSCQLSTGMN